MIKNIAKIERLGVYQNYSKPSDCQDFGIKNLIYGWNYSGKTTLSRIFAQIENGKINPDFAGSSFRIEVDGGIITESNLAQVGLMFKVFNSDFIQENLNFVGQSFKPILLLGKESGDAQKALDIRQAQMLKAQELIKGYAKKSNEIESAFAVSKTQTAAKIKKELGLVAAYTATHLSTDIEKIKGLDKSCILDGESLRDDLKLALTPDSERPGTVDRIEITPQLANLYADAQGTLAAIPALSSTIKHLEENPDIERWVDTGLSLHESKESCEFCGSAIPMGRMVELAAHFSKELLDHKRKVESLLSRVQSAKIQIALPKSAEFSPQFRQKFEESSKVFSRVLADFNSKVFSLAADVQKKKDFPFKAVEISETASGISAEIGGAKDALNQIIDENNRISADFVNEKTNAILRARQHFVQEFIDASLASNRANTIRRFGDKQARVNRFMLTAEQESNRLKAIISLAQLGREEVNSRLIWMLGPDALQIQVVSEAGLERFQLVRKNGVVAKYISEGEKTAIAFSYFLTKLKELTEAQFQAAIIYIDDPISSLDANHIFQVTAAIKDVFFKKSSVDGSWTTCCKQLFVSTHNFEFFHLLQELQPHKASLARLFFIKRTGEASILQNMPASLARHKSEYRFLFDLIHRFHMDPNKTNFEDLMLLPNAIRRFVELYTFSRLPKAGAEVDARAEVLFGAEKAKRILKVLHYFSHSNGMDRMVNISELVFDIEFAVADLFKEMEDKDPTHWGALMDTIV